MTTKQSQIIQLLRFPLIVAVVFLHCYGQPMDRAIAEMNFGALSFMDWYDIIRFAISLVIGPLGVPSFFFISGFLFFFSYRNDKFEWSFFKNKYKSRWLSLGIPYLTWITMAILINLVLLQFAAYVIKDEPLDLYSTFQSKGWAHMYWDSEVWGLSRKNILGWPSPSTGPYLIPFWYIRDLICAVIFSPLIYLFIKRLKFWSVAIMFLCYATGIWFITPGFSTDAFFFFIFGSYFSINRKEFIEVFDRKNVWLPSIIICLLHFIPMIYFEANNTATGRLIYPFYITTGVITVFHLTSVLFEKGRVKVSDALADSSFFVFGMHTILMIWIADVILSHTFGTSSALSLIMSYILRPIIVVVMCEGIYFALKKFAPPYYGVCLWDLELRKTTNKIAFPL